MLNKEIIQQVLKQKHGLCIGERVAEELLLELKRRLAEIKLPVKGRSFTSGLPQTVEVAAVELLEIS